jgi:hypothetical protein
MIDLEKVKGYESLTPRRKGLFKSTFPNQYSCWESEQNKKKYTPIKVENADYGVKVTFKNKSWLHYYTDGTWG